MKFRLTRAQRQALFNGNCPKLVGEGKCPVIPGYTFMLSSLVTIKVVGVRTSKRHDRWSLEYEVHDRRDPARLLRRTPSIHFDDWATQHRSDEEWEREAAEESAYTTGGKSAITDAGEAVDNESLKTFAREAEDKHAQHQQARKERWERLTLEERAREIQTLAPLSEADVSRELRLAAHALGKAKDKIDRKAA